MTREEAIEELKAIRSAYSDKKFHEERLMNSEEQALDMAIKALSQEPCRVKNELKVELNELEPCEKPTSEDAIKTIQELMIACTPDSKYYRVGQMAISAILENEELSKDLDEALREIDEYEQRFEQEPTVTSTDEPMTMVYPTIFCDDAISRKEILKYAEVLRDDNKTGYKAVKTKYIRNLPSVTQKSGEWRAHSDGGIWIKYYECSECGKIHDTHSDYCPNCGCRMVKPQEKRCENCNHYGKLSLDCGRCDDDCSMYEPQESEEQTE